MASPIETIFYLRDLQFTAWQYGLLMGLPSLGGFFGARLTRRTVARFGAVRALWWTSMIRGPWNLLIPLAAPGLVGLVQCGVGFFSVLFLFRHGELGHVQLPPTGHTRPPHGTGLNPVDLRHDGRPTTLHPCGRPDGQSARYTPDPRPHNGTDVWVGAPTSPSRAQRAAMKLWRGPLSADRQLASAKSSGTRPAHPGDLLTRVVHDTRRSGRPSAKKPRLRRATCLCKPSQSPCSSDRARSGHELASGALRPRNPRSEKCR